MKAARLVPGSLAVLVAVACSHAKPAETPAAEAIAQPAPPPAKIEQPAPLAPMGAPKPEAVAPAPPVKEIAPQPVTASIYFAFDKSDLTPESVAVLDSLIDRAMAPGARVRIEGNCDERGSVEYNIALGQRRADAAKNYLVRLGVSEAAIIAISFGEERPKAPGHDEASWRENRRDDIFVQAMAVSSR